MRLNFTKSSGNSRRSLSSLYIDQLLSNLLMYFTLRIIFPTKTEKKIWASTSSYTPQLIVPRNILCDAIFIISVGTVALPFLQFLYVPFLYHTVFYQDSFSLSFAASNRSRSSTSVRRSFSSTLTQETGPISEVAGDPNSGTSTKPKSKKLADLFRESMRERDGVGLTVTSPLPPKSANRAPSALRYSVSSTDIVDDNLPVEDKSAKYKHRCFPRLVYVRSFSESKRTSTPPTSMNGDLKAWRVCSLRLWFARFCLV